MRVGGRIQELEAQPGETAQSFRARVAPLVESPVLLEGSRRQFEAFVSKLTDALRSAFPEGEIVEAGAQALVVRPQSMPSKQKEPAYREIDRRYDPYQRYYDPSPFDGMLSGLLIGLFLSSAFHPGIMVVHPSGAPIASADQARRPLGRGRRGRARSGRAGRWLRRGRRRR